MRQVDNYLKLTTATDFEYDAEEFASVASGLREFRARSATQDDITTVVFTASYVFTFRSADSAGYREAYRNMCELRDDLCASLPGMTYHNCSFSVQAWSDLAERGTPGLSLIGWPANDAAP